MTTAHTTTQTKTIPATSHFFSISFPRRSCASAYETLWGPYGIYDLSPVCLPETNTKTGAEQPRHYIFGLPLTFFSGKNRIIILKTLSPAHILFMDIDRLGIVITAACLLVLFFAVPMAGLTNNGYVVTPATDADIANSTPLETVPVSFWDLPPRVMLTAVALSFSPLLLYPLELFFFLKMFAYLGYRKISAASVLKNVTRSRIYQAIAANPGIFFNELARQTGIARSTIRYHLALLRITGKISVAKTGSDTRYFENSGKFSGTEQKILALLQNGRDRLICEYLIQNPATTRGDLEKVLGISGAAVTWHTNRLRDAGVLAVTKSGRTVRYSIAPDAVCALHTYYPQETGAGAEEPK